MSESIIDATFLGISKNRICFSSLLKFFLSSVIARKAVWSFAPATTLYTRCGAAGPRAGEMRWGAGVVDAGACVGARGCGNVARGTLLCGGVDAVP